MRFSEAKFTPCNIFMCINNLMRSQNLNNHTVVRFQTMLFSIFIKSFFFFTDNQNPKKFKLSRSLVVGQFTEIQTGTGWFIVKVNSNIVRFQFHSIPLEFYAYVGNSAHFRKFSYKISENLPSIC